MVSPNAFWLQLHQLAVAYRAEGLGTPARKQNIVDQFHEMPLITQRELIADLLY